MDQFIFIDKDFLSMSEAERDGTIVGSGKINFSRLYMVIHNTKVPPTEEQRDRAQRAYECALKQMNRCQVDLITAEFGINKKRLDQVTPYTDTFTDNPASANVKKLNDALKMIRDAM